MNAPDELVAATVSAGSSSVTRLRGQWVWVARLVWVVGFTALTAMYALGVLAVHETLSTVCRQAPCTLREQVRHTQTGGQQVLGWPGPPIGYADPLRPGQVEALGTLGLTLDQYGWLAALQMGLPALLYLLIAAGLFWRKSDDWMVLFASAMVATLPLANMPLAFTLVVRQPAWEGVFAPATVVALSCLLIFPLIFPTGRFVPRWTRWMAVLSIAGAIIVTLFRNAALEVPGANDFVVVYIGLGFGTGVYAQLYRYFRVATPAERQQLKWVVVGLAGFVTSAFAVLIPLDVLLASPMVRADPAQALLLSVIPDTLFLATSLFIPVSIAISVLRYRLWDIDLVFNRALVYTTLTGTLAAVYFGCVFGAQAVVQALTGQTGQQPVIVVVSTLLIAGLFNPLRRRLQATIDRRFYRRKYDAARTLAGFGTALRTETDLARLSQRLVAVVEETMQPSQVSLWLAPRAPPVKPSAWQRADAAEAEVARLPKPVPLPGLFAGPEGPQD